MGHRQLSFLVVVLLVQFCTSSSHEKIAVLQAELGNINQSVGRMSQLLNSLQSSEVVYASCDTVPSNSSGVYKIQTNLHEVSEVYCDQKYDGGGWTVIQNRFDGSVNFFRDWNEYKRGFGNLDGGEFWLGLEVIHQLTYSAPHELVVLLEDFDGNSTYAKLDRFEMAGEQTAYKVTLAEGFSGPAGDSITGTKNAMFSTFDRDNDTWSSNCAVTYHGAWWYTACHASNLNGKYLKGGTTEYATGMVWNTFRGYYYALKSAKMMIRRKKI